ncbi:MAG TPA: HAMP domain-containing sensor histidine kinase [Selenomonadales bacterium]|nr:HAMP domain-containing sensor histidine kinase [Selenomonadales bacterium]
MFQRLRQQLTLLNVSIILALFLLLIVGTYYFTQIELTRRTQFIARQIMAHLQASGIDQLASKTFRPEPGLPPGMAPIPGGPPGFPPPPNFFFLKTTPEGAIAVQSLNQRLTPDDLSELARRTLSADERQGMFVFEEIPYFYLKTSLEDHSGTLLLFKDMSLETGIQRDLLSALIIVGLVCTVLSFFGSFFLANRAMIPIRRAWDQQKAFLSDASHELRTPLAVIQTNLDIAMGNPDETVAGQYKWLSNIREESVGMAKLVDSLLFLARADSHQQSLDKRAFSLNASLLRAAAPFEPVAAAKGIALTVRVDPPIRYYGDESRIKQVVGILLDNALRHTPAGGKVSLALAKSADTIILTVADTGEGIPVKHQANIFDRFFQVDSARAKGGAGLGLAIAKWIVESHGGTIQVASDGPGKGTAFSIRFPGT